MSEWKKVEQPLTPEEPAPEPDTVPEERAPETLPPAPTALCFLAAVYRGRSAPRPE